MRVPDVASNLESKINCKSLVNPTGTVLITKYSIFELTTVELSNFFFNCIPVSV